VLTFIAVIVVAYAAIAGFLYVFQRSFVFLPGGTLVAPAEAGLHSVEVVTIAMADATLLTGWYAEPQAGQPSVLYFHGNGGNISMRADYFRHILGSGFGLLAMSYRGYPGSGGSPSEEALLADGLELFDWLAARVGTIVIYGESLGSAVGIYVAAEREAGAVILEAPFTAAVDIARGAYPWLPVGLLMHDQFLSRERIGRVEEPVLIVHGADDWIVPAKHGRRLFAMAGEPKRLEVFEAAGHEDLWGRGLWPVALDFLQEHGVAAQPAP
jgi:fermentation-respiration switch protein FrsA (DUF1100 family)